MKWASVSGVAERERRSRNQTWRFSVYGPEGRVNDTLYLA